MFRHPKSLENIRSHVPRSGASWANISTEIFDRSTVSSAAKIRSEIRALRKSIRDKCLGLKKGRACPDYEIPKCRVKGDVRQSGLWKHVITVGRVRRHDRRRNHNPWVTFCTRWFNEPPDLSQRDGRIRIFGYLYSGREEGREAWTSVHAHVRTHRSSDKEGWGLTGLSCDDWLRSFTRAPYRSGSLYRLYVVVTVLMVPVNWLIDTLIKLSASMLIHLNTGVPTERNAFTSDRMYRSAFCIRWTPYISRRIYTVSRPSLW